MSSSAEDRPGVGIAHRVPDLGALELLLAVARLGSLGRAARELGITQPAASSRIRSMERLLDFSFEWVLPGHGRPVRLSRADMHASLERCVQWMRT